MDTLLNTHVAGFSLLSIVSWIIFGFIVGMIVHAIDPGHVRGGVVGTTLLGILGALFGGLLSSIIFGVVYTGFSVEGFLTAIVGGLVLAFLSRFIFRETGHIKTTTTQLR